MTIADEEYDPPDRVPLTGADVVHVVCRSGHGRLRAFDVVFLRAAGGHWRAWRADDAENRRPGSRGGVVPFANGDGFTIECTVCTRKVRVRSDVLNHVLDAVNSFGGKEVMLDTMALAARQ